MHGRHPTHCEQMHESATRRPNGRTGAQPHERRKPHSVLLARRCAVRLAHRTRHAHAEVGTTVGTRLHIATRTGHTHGTATGHMGHMDMERAPSRSAPPHLPYSSTRIYGMPLQSQGIAARLGRPRSNRQHKRRGIRSAALLAPDALRRPLRVFRRVGSHPKRLPQGRVLDVALPKLFA